MKYNRIFLSVLLTLLLFSTCQREEVMTFEGVDYIVFRYRMVGQGVDLTAKRVRESAYNSAAFNLASFIDVTSIRFAIRVQVIGNQSDVDRPIAFRLAPGSTALLGEDIVLLPSYIRAGNSIDTLWVQINETESLREGRTFRAYIELIDNDHFKSDFKFRDVANRDNWTISNRFTIDVHYTTGLPNLWVDLFRPGVGFNWLAEGFGPLGAGCQARFNLMREVSGFSEQEFWDIFTYNPEDFPSPVQALSAHPLDLSNTILMWFRLVSATLREAREAGGPRLDDNGYEITLMGWLHNL